MDKLAEYDQLIERARSYRKGDELEPFQYFGSVESVIDGDTLELGIDLGFNTMVFERFRLFGVNTPEVYGVHKDSQEYQLGAAASSFTKELLPKGTKIEVSTFKASKRDKYGRWLAEVFVNGQSVNRKIIEAGFGEPASY